MKKLALTVVAGLSLAVALTSCKNDVAVDPQSPMAQTPAKPSAPVGKTTLVTIESVSPGSFELALPVHSNNQRIKFEELKDVTGKWEQTFGGERMRSLEQGAKFTATIISDKPEIPFLQTLDGATVKITVDGQSREVSLKGDKYDWRPEKLY